MEIVIAAVVVALGLAAGLVAAASLLAKRVPGYAAHRGSAPPPAAVAAPIPPSGEEADDQLERRARVGKLQQRLGTPEAQVDPPGAQLQRHAERRPARGAAEPER